MMTGTNLNDLAVFAAIVAAGSIAGGGKASGLSRSAAAKAVARLEGRLGVRLLHRTTRSLSLTEEGRVFHDKALSVLDAVDAAEASVAGSGGTPRGILRLTLPDAFGRHVVLPLLHRYLTEWPDLQAEVSLTDRVADVIGEGFDLAIRIGGSDADSGLIARVLTRFSAPLCAAPAYLAARGTPATPGALNDHDCLYFSSAARRQAWRLPGPDGAERAVSGRSRLRLDSAEALRDAALAGLGIAQLPDFLIADDLAAGRLVPVLPAWQTDAVPVLALYPDRRYLEPRVRRFIDLLAASLPS